MESLSSLTVADLLERLASKTPAPGGGAVAGLVGAQAAALASMVVAYSLGRKSLAQHQEQLESISQQLENARGLLLVLADADADAYAELSALWKLPVEDTERIERFQPAVREAILVPQSVMAAAADLLRLCEALAPISNANLASDLRASAILAYSSAEAAALNVRVNAPQLADDHERAGVLAACDSALISMKQRRDRVVA